MTGKDRRTILVVDDDDALVDALSAVFDSSGYRVITAATEDAAREAARSARPDLIILDVMLSAGAEGFHLAQEFRADDELCEVPILMLTGIHQRAPFRFSPETDGEFLPVDRFLEKPVDPARLLREVNELLAER